MKIFIQGYYISANQMSSVLINNRLVGANANQCDTLMVSLMDSVTHAAVDSCKNVLSTSGNWTVAFPAAVLGAGYYLKITHRNSLETWSSNPVIMNNTTTFDLSADSSLAFGKQVRHIEAGVWAIYSGDIDQDGEILPSDLDYIETASHLFQFGYLPGDLTGDGLVESSDYSLIENNLIGQLQVQKP